MQVYQISFGYKSVLKDEYLRGKIKIKKDITGHTIDKDTVSLDHTVPKYRGGKSQLENYSLMNTFINQRKGHNKLTNFIDLKSLVDYIIVMMDVDTEKINGIDYLRLWLRNLRKEI